MNSETSSEPPAKQVSSQDLYGAGADRISLQLQLETRERLVRLEEENRHLRERVSDMNDKQKRLRQSFDGERSASQQQINDRAGKLSQRVDTLGRRLDRLFSFWMISTMLLMLFTVALMLKTGL